MTDGVSRKMDTQSEAYVAPPGLGIYWLGKNPPLTRWANVWRASGAWELPLLLVVDGGGADFFAGGVGAFGGDGAGFAVGGEDDAAGYKNLVALLDGERQRVIIDFLDGPRIGRGIAGDRVVFAVELAHPLVVRWLAGGIGAVDGDHHVVAHGRVDDRGVLGRSRGEFRLGLIQFPGAEKTVGGEAHCRTDQAQCQGHNDSSCFHIPSKL